MNPALICEECAYLQKEREGIHIDSGMPEIDAVIQSQSERCLEHGGEGSEARREGAPGKESI